MNAVAAAPIRSVETRRPPHPAPADDSLLARLRAGEERAYEELVRESGGRLLSVAQRILRSPDDAADAVQEAFLAAFRSIGSFEGNSSLSTWLHRILVNACLMKLRSRARRREVCAQELPRGEEAGRRSVPVPAWVEDPHAALASEEVRAMVRRTIQGLPDPLRLVLLLRDIEELDTAETARVLGISKANVKTRLHRARLALRARIDPALASRQ